jgi:hypothetical protein
MLSLSEQVGSIHKYFYCYGDGKKVCQNYIIQIIFEEPEFLPNKETEVLPGAALKKQPPKNDNDESSLVRSEDEFVIPNLEVGENVDLLPDLYELGYEFQRNILLLKITSFKWILDSSKDKSNSLIERLKIARQNETIETYSQIEEIFSRYESIPEQKRNSKVHKVEKLFSKLLTDIEPKKEEFEMRLTLIDQIADE